MSSKLEKTLNSMSECDLEALFGDDNEKAYETFKKKFSKHLHRFFAEEMCKHIEIETDKEYYQYDHHGHYVSRLYYTHQDPSED